MKCRTCGERPAVEGGASCKSCRQYWRDRYHRAKKHTRPLPKREVLAETLIAAARLAVTQPLCAHRDDCLDQAIAADQDVIDCRACISFRRDPQIDEPRRLWMGWKVLA